MITWQFLSIVGIAFVILEIFTPSMFFLNFALADKGEPDKYLIAMKYLETMKTITSGKDNKFVYMPYEATGILSSIDGIKQMLSK